MGRRRRRGDGRETFAEIVQAQQQTDSPQPLGSIESALGSGELVDDAGLVWRPVRQPRIGLRRAEQLARRPGVKMVIEESPGQLAWVADEQRWETWVNRLRPRFDGPGGKVVGPPWPQQPTYGAVEWQREDRARLLLFETYC
jgi:hypothetical protein